MACGFVGTENVRHCTLDKFVGVRQTLRYCGASCRLCDTKGPMTGAVAQCIVVSIAQQASGYIHTGRGVKVGFPVPSDVASTECKRPTPIKIWGPANTHTNPFSVGLACRPGHGARKCIQCEPGLRCLGSQCRPSSDPRPAKCQGFRCRRRGALTGRFHGTSYSCKNSL